MGVKSLSGHAGMLEGYLERAVEKPCAGGAGGECSILRLVGGLEYANGSSANINTGMWYALPPSSCFGVWLVENACWLMMGV
jgi:hypothetical protein